MENVERKVRSDLLLTRDDCIATAYTCAQRRIAILNTRCNADGGSVKAMSCDGGMDRRISADLLSFSSLEAPGIV
jgi:hypothetical protein